MKADREGQLLYQFAAMNIDLGVEMKQQRTPYALCPTICMRLKTKSRYEWLRSERDDNNKNNMLRPPFPAGGSVGRKEFEESLVVKVVSVMVRPPASST